jgi:cell shape-determining protein MreC
MTLMDYILRIHALPATDVSESEARVIGEAMGSWLQQFTQWAASQVELRAVAEKNTQGQFFRHLVTFGSLKERVEQYPAILGEIKDVFAEVEQAAIEELKDPSTLQLIHGDFWTGK